MGYLNNIFNSLRVISEGSNYSTTGFTVTHSGTSLTATSTSFIVRDGGYVGIGTNLPNTGWGANANLHVVGNARVTNIPTGGKVYLTTDVKGNILQNSGVPIIAVSGDCVVSSAYTSGISGCTLFLITNCTGDTAPGRLLVNGYISYTADTCSDFLNGSTPYEFGTGTMSIQPKLAANNSNAPFSSIGGGSSNWVMDGSVYSRVGTGLNNVLKNDSAFSSIVGGNTNLVTFSDNSIIAAGSLHTIEQANNSSIVGGLLNSITGTSYGAIINGQANLVKHANSAIIGSSGKITDRAYTTFTEGLDVDTTRGGLTKAQALKYHGTWAQPGLNYVLTDIDGLGNAQWQPNPSNRATWTGDCVVTSAYTVGCILYMQTNCTGSTPGSVIVNGNITYTADTCNSFTNGPYRFGAGLSAIEPILGGNQANGMWANITGGLGNRLDTVGNYNTVVGGIDNTVTGYSVSVIVQGHHNRIYGNNVGLGYATVLNGFENVNRHQYSTILNGRNITTTRDYTTFANGLELNTNDGAGNQQPLRYHGTFANEGINRILTDIDGLGNSVWRRNTAPGVSWTGDQYVTSAYTTGCTLFITTNSGNTFTADTCNTFNTSPYEWGIGTNSIQPILLGNSANANYSSIGGGFINNVTTGSNMSRVGGGMGNSILGDSIYSFIGGGLSNIITNGSNSVNILGGNTNIINLSAWSSIVGGMVNQIRGASNYSTILGGLSNIITGASFSAIINGSDNKVLAGHNGSVVMNGPSMVSDDDYTTYTRGLNVNTVNSTGGAKYLKYHGTLANPGFGKVLVDSTGFGDAVWADGGTFTFSGDQFVTSAYTSGCTLYIVTNSGNTFTANTCNSFGGTSPYEYRGGTDSISTVLPGNGNPGDNFIKNNMPFSNIGGGSYNKLNTSGPGHSNIAGGYDNTIGGSNIKVPEGSSGYDFIGGGYQNRIRGLDTYNQGIGAGELNWILASRSSFICGGYANIITGSSKNFIGGGQYNLIQVPGSGSANESSIVGGGYNEIYSKYSVIAGGESNQISSMGGGNTSYAGIFNGSGNTIGRNAEYAAIIGSRGINYANSPETTYMKGLDANTNGYNGIDRPLKYHGTYANQGVGKVLTSNAIGQASWQNPGFIDGLSGDCVVSTAYTVNCILYLVTSCTGTTAPNRILVGNHITYTANTCTSFGGTSPYEYGIGTGSIQTTLALSNNSANGNWFDVVSGGRYNKTNHFSYHSGIHAGYNNAMTGSVQTFIGAGKQNRVVFHEDGAIVAGMGNYLGTINKTPGSASAPGMDDLKGSFIGAGAYNEILKSEESSIVGGQYNLLRGTYQSFIGGGDHNILTGDSGSVLVGGYYNTMKSSLRSFIGGGANNELHDGQYNTIVGGFNHHINNSGNNNFIGGGDSNILGDIGGEGLNTDFSSILGGKSNQIAGDGTADYAAIVNGQSNTVTASYAAIIGGQSLTANRRHTTFMNGLDVDVASISGTRHLRYHGGGSNVGTAGDVLTSLNALGDTIWATPTSPGVSFTGDCAVVSAYTSGCLLYMVTDCTGATGSQYIIQGGNIVYTANTCNSQGTGPYRFGANNGIEPILGVNNSDGFRASIGGGQNNTVDVDSTWSNIGAGVSNTITDSRVSSILGGHQNSVAVPGVGSGYGAIINGFQNQVTHEYSVVMGGSGISSDKSFTTFMNGLDVDTNAVGVNRYFKYYGTLAGPGLNNVLTDVDGTGNAVWRKNTPQGTVSFSGDQFVTSAYTLGCTLYVVTNSGNTFTADTCNTFNEGPYEFGSGFNSIQSKLGNNLADGYYSNIGGGLNNQANQVGLYNSISSGIDNKISGYSVSVIVQGHHNRITGNNTTNGYSSVLNGFQNTVTHRHSTILNGINVSSTRDHTVFANGLELNTLDGNGTQQPFKYYGGYANPGLNKILVSDAVGNAHWENLSTPGIAFSGDQYVVSAYTTGCTLFITTNSGNTFTADTCNDFSDSPYEYRGNNSISTKLPGSGNPGDNFIRPGTSYSNIGGGWFNKINTSGVGYSNIAGGYNNTIGGEDIGFTVGASGYDFIGGGRNNKITGTDSYNQSIVGGRGNSLLLSNSGFIGGGTDNIITGSTGGFVGGGTTNLINRGEGNASNSSILGGTYNSIFSSKGSVITGGRDNTISQLSSGGNTDYAGIFNGSGNTIGRNAEYAAIIGARGVLASNPETTYMKGLDANTNGYDGIDRPFTYHGTYANQGVGKVLTSDATGKASWQPIGIPTIPPDEVVVSARTTGCTITFYTNSGSTFTADTCGGGYSPYRPMGDNSIVPTLPASSAVGENIIDNTSEESTIAGGLYNKIITSSDRSVIAGGQNNRIQTNSDWSNIGGGVTNKITDARVSSILGGHQNTIEIAGSSNGYGVIVGGFTNKVQNIYSTILNGRNITTTRDYTTFANGLELNTTTAGGEQQFRYHGTIANAGVGRILTSDASGNATWEDNKGNVSFSGDQYVVSAYTTGCTLFVTTNSGNTLTANTCNSFSETPYEYAAGGNSNIQPKLGNNIHDPNASMMWNNIDGGQNNRIWAGTFYNSSLWSHIGGGRNNAISGGSFTNIVGGLNNIIENVQYGTIVGGVYNKISTPYGYQQLVGIFNGAYNEIISGPSYSSTIYSTIINGIQNTISAATHSTILGGNQNIIRSEANFSVILGSQSITASTPSTAYMTNSQTMGKARIASQNYLSMNGLYNQSPITALDVVHETDNLSGMANDTGGGEIVRFGVAGGDYTKGSLVQLRVEGATPAAWYQASATDLTSQGNMLGIALGTTPENGILIRGHYRISNPGFSSSVGSALYVSTINGKITNTPPTTATQYVRAVGYQEIEIEDTAVIYFNPDSTYITLV